MKTLLERLKPEFREKLEGDFKEKWPNSYELFKEKLSAINYITEMNYDLACDLDAMLNDSKGTRVMAMYDLFQFDRS